VKENELKAEVKKTYYYLVTLEHKRRLLLHADSIYAAFMHKADLRYKAGDIDKLEKLTAESQRVQIHNQLLMLETENQVTLNEFWYLLNSKEKPVPADSDPVYVIRNLPDSSLIDNSPAIQIAKLEIEQSSQLRQLEKAKLLPSFNIGYSNLSIVGFQKIGTEEKFFEMKNRFSSLNLGLGISIIKGAQRSRIKASDVLIRQREAELAAYRQQAGTAFLNALRRYYDYQHVVETYQNILLKNVSATIDIANRRLAGGEITYIEWVIFINQALEIRSGYFDAVERMNDASFLLEKITSIN
jgi:cobalt-zinc-cadmium resistance protein CzcA